LEVGESNSVSTSAESVAEKDDENDDDAGSERDDRSGNEKSMTFSRCCEVEEVYGCDKDREDEKKDEDECVIEIAASKVVSKIPGGIVVIGDFLGAIGRTLIIGGEGRVDFVAIPFFQIDYPEAEAGVGVGGVGVEKTFDLECIKVGAVIVAREVVFGAENIEDTS
jgi:hypothetical protein